ncbi:helix-turn-helix domain-containing protein [Actinoplanes sp. NPDC024001]|uniref:helix-turn-helix domain-containing protein n=1 Tax=Actinoplanes sp. NPDC024001 TaxID=3154598 RepID=UPI0033EDF6C7
MTWEHPEVRAALRVRDLATVYKALGKRGFSQRRIAAMTGQSPSEVYEIVRGRQVMAYDLLVRIADGLGVPRGYMGLAYDTDESPAWQTTIAANAVPVDELTEVRQLLSHSATITMGVSSREASRWWQPSSRIPTPVPTHVGFSDVTQHEHIIGVLRALDYQYGGGACRDAVLAQTAYVRAILTSATIVGEAKLRLRLALADLQNLAGWTSFDVGLFSAGRRLFARALEEARECEDLSLAANVLYRLGRLHLHRAYIAEALKFFQLGQLVAQDADDPLTIAMLCANEAWAYALMGDRNKALSSLGRAQDEFTRPRTDHVPGWVSFFGTADLHALMGMVYGLLAPTGQTDDPARAAITHLAGSLNLRADGMTRSRTFELTALASVYLDNDEIDLGAQAGNEAVDLAERMRSVRTIDRLTPLLAAAERHPRDERAVALAQRVATLQAGWERDGTTASGKRVG